MLRLQALCLTALPYACSPNKITGAPATANAERSQNLSEDDAEEELSLEEILSQCGVDPDKLDDDEAIVFEKTIRSWPKVFSGQEAVPIVGSVDYFVKVTTVLTIKATAIGSEQITDFEIDATPAMAEGRAREKTAPNRGSTITTGLSLDERTALMGEAGDWDRIVCTVQPVKELSTSKGGMGKVVEFDPPLPGSISPKADAARYKAEIGEGRTFSDIVATVVGSSDPNMPKGEKIKGSVKITRVPARLTLDVSGKSSETVNADDAYKVEYKFGSVDETVALGLMPSQTFYIDHSEKDIKAIVADTGFEEGGTVVLIDGLTAP